MALKAIALNCSLKSMQGEPSSTDKMIGLLVSELAKKDVQFSETIRIAEHNVKPGVTSDEGEGDAWPELRRKILDHDILIFGTPVWLGQMSSVAKRVLERMDAFLSETDERGRMPSYSKVAIVAIVGNEDGAHGVNVLEGVERDAPQHVGGVVAEMPRGVAVRRLVQRDGEQHRQGVEGDSLNEVCNVHQAIVAGAGLGNCRTGL